MQCVDAETLAAWADGGLPKPEAVSGGAAPVRMRPLHGDAGDLRSHHARDPGADSLWQRWHLRWLVPVATAATVAALWVLIPRPDSVPTAISDSDVATQAQTPDGQRQRRQPPTDTKEQRLADARTRVGSTRSSRQSARSRAHRRLHEHKTNARGAAGSPGPASRGGPSTRGRADPADQRTTDLQAQSEPPPPLPRLPRCRSRARRRAAAATANSRGTASQDPATEQLADLRRRRRAVRGRLPRFR